MRIQAAVFANRGLRHVDQLGAAVAPLGLRLILAWEFFESGREKYLGSNWFGDIQDQFPLPFNLIPPEISWQIATWFELAGACALLLGLGTRFFALSLMVLTVVATLAVHWPAEWHSLSELALGYVISDSGHGNFKLPLLFLVMLLPLTLQGAGMLSVDYWLKRRWLGGSMTAPRLAAA